MWSSIARSSSCVLTPLRTRRAARSCAAATMAPALRISSISAGDLRMIVSVQCTPQGLRYLVDRSRCVHVDHVVTLPEELEHRPRLLVEHDDAPPHHLGLVVRPQRQLAAAERAGASLHLAHAGHALAGVA